MHQFVEVAWAFVEFARNDPDLFKVIFSSVVEKEKDFPAFVEMTRKNFRLLVELVEACQAAGVLKPGAADEMAVSIWSLVHGLASLLIEGQISHAILNRRKIRELLIFTLNQVTLVELTPAKFPLED